MNQAAPSGQAEGAPNSTKACVVCKTWQPVSSYSGAQLKKQGKRTCRACVEKANPPQPSQPPPLSIAAADRITAEEIHRVLPRLIAQVASLAVHAVAPPHHDELAPALSAICKIYPPSRPFAWWDATDTDSIQRVEREMAKFTAAMLLLVTWASSAYSDRTLADAANDLTASPQIGWSPFMSPPVYRGKSIFEDDARLIHKMLVHWIYFTKHFPSVCKAKEQHLYDDISQPNYGHTRT